MHKIKSMLCNYSYRKHKRTKYYLNHLPLIIKIQARMKGFLIRKNLRIMDQVKERLYQNKSKYVLIIQKVWRGYNLRKRLKALNNQDFAYKDDEIDNMVEFNDDFFN